MTAAVALDVKTSNFVTYTQKYAPWGYAHNASEWHAKEHRILLCNLHPDGTQEK